MCLPLPAGTCRHVPSRIVACRHVPSRTVDTCHCLPSCVAVPSAVFAPTRPLPTGGSYDKNPKKKQYGHFPTDWMLGGGLR